MIRQFQLKNGMKVLLRPSHKSPVVSVQVWVRTGSADEKKGEEGISHFIEHLLFKGTQKFAVGEIARAIEGAGGELNAYTSFDQTVFHVTLSNKFLDLGLESLKEMMGFPLFDQEEVDKEREVVVEEIKRGLDSLGRQASQLLFSNAYPSHPYAIPVIGFEKNVRKWSVSKIKSYFDSRYSPSNMFLVVTGDFDVADVKKKIQDTFATIPAKKFEKRKRPIARSWKPKVLIRRSQFEQSIAYLAWPVPSADHKDIAALEVLAAFLGQGDSSRLVKNLRLKKPLVSSIGASVFSGTERGLFVISFSFKKENWAAIIAEIKSTLEEFLIHPPNADDFARVLHNFESEQLFAFETVDGISRQIGYYEFLFENPKYLDQYLKRVQALKTTDVLKVFKKYIEPRKTLLTGLTNDDATRFKAVAQRELRNWKWPAVNSRLKHQKTKTKKFSWKPLREGKTAREVAVISMKGGGKLVLYPSKETPLISARAIFQGGSREDQVQGTHEVIGKTWLSGSQHYTEEALALEIEKCAASINASTGRNTLGLSVDMLKPFEKKCGEIFLDVLTRPLFENEMIDREKIIQKDQIRNRKDNPAQICIRQFSELIFGTHPYAQDPLGTENSLALIDSSAVKNVWQRIAKNKNLTLIVGGNLDLDYWKEVADQSSASLSPGEFKYSPHHWSAPKKKQKGFIFSEKEQSHFVCGFPGLTMKDVDRFALHLIESILAGQGGRLFLELRDKNSLAYTVSPLRMEGLDAGYFGAYIGCSPEKVKTAYEMMKQEFQKLCDIPVLEEELVRAKRYLIGRHDIDMQRTHHLVSSIGYDFVYGLDPNATFKVDEIYQSVSAQQIQKVAQRIFTQQETISIVGPKDAIAI